jgi:hypothetical protein
MKDRRPYESREAQEAAREYAANYSAQRFLGLCEHLGLDPSTVSPADFFATPHWAIGLYGTKE